MGGDDQREKSSSVMNTQYLRTDGNDVNGSSSSLTPRIVGIKRELLPPLNAPLQLPRRSFQIEGQELHRIPLLAFCIRVYYIFFAIV
jgi:hypothetical protein